MLNNSIIHNRRNNFLVLREERTGGINSSVSTAEKNFSINFTKAKTKFWFSLHSNGDNSYLFFNGKEIYKKFKSDNKSANFLTEFCLGRIFEKFDAVESREVSFEENVNDFSVDYNAIEKSAILNIHSNIFNG